MVLLSFCLGIATHINIQFKAAQDYKRKEEEKLHKLGEKKCETKEKGNILLTLNLSYNEYAYLILETFACEKLN